MKDHMQRELNVGDAVFYNGALYRVTGFSKKQQMVSLNYLTGSQLQKPKLRYSREILLVGPDVTYYLLTLGEKE